MTAMHMISGYRNLPGKHCGSSAMRNLLNYYCGLDLTEEETFGLGSGVDFLMLQNDEFEPRVLLFGRGPTMEVDAAAALGVDYREQPVLDDDEAWQQVRDEVVEGRPTMLSGDVFYLDYRDFKVRFPAHRFVLLGFDDAKGVAYLADRIDPETQVCSYKALRISRNPPDFISTHNLWGKFYDTSVGRPLDEAFAVALEKSTRRMLAQDTSQVELIRLASPGESVGVASGLDGLGKLLKELPRWPEYPDVELIARYAAQCIEKFGTGGGNFRAMYTDFLRQARVVVPDLVDDAAPELAAQSSAQWTELSACFGELGKQGAKATDEIVQRCTDAVSIIIDRETQLFLSLDARLAH